VDSGFEHPSEGKLSNYLYLSFTVIVVLCCGCGCSYWDDFGDFRLVMVIIAIVMKN